MFDHQIFEKRISESECCPAFTSIGLVEIINFKGKLLEGEIIKKENDSWHSFSQQAYLTQSTFLSVIIKNV